MIAKEISRTTADNFSRLVKYAVNEEKQNELARSWGDIAKYAADFKHQGDKAPLGYRLTNFDGVRSLNDAIDIVERMQEGAKSKKGTDKNYHLVISFPPGEIPEKDQLADIEDELMKAIGFEDHQRISAIHTDQEHFHVHVAVNKVHPSSNKVVSPYQSKNRLMATCRKLEIKHNLTQTHADHVKLKNGEIIIVGKAADFEAHTGEESFQRWVKVNIKEAFCKAGSWDELYKISYEHGIIPQKRGAGLIFVSTENSKLAIKGSDIDRTLSLKSLETRLGKMEEVEYLRYQEDQEEKKATSEPKIDVSDEKPETKKYERKPLKRSPEAEALWNQYTEKKTSAPEKRKVELEEIKTEVAAQRANVKAEAKDHRVNARYRFYTPEQKHYFKEVAAQKLLKIKEDAAKKRTEAYESNRAPNWYDFLQDEAKQGNGEALKLLRQINKRRETFERNILRASNWEEGQNIVLTDSKRSVSKDGTVRYYTTDGGVVTDRSDHIGVQDVSVAAATLALSLASKRFSHPLKVQGSDEFKAAVAAAAALPNSQIVFADHEMEELRKKAVIRRVTQERRYSDDKTYLFVPHLDRPDAKAAGAKWDIKIKRWYVPAKTDLDPFVKWNKVQKGADLNGVGTSLIVPFEYKDAVKELGAEWNKDTKSWIVPAGVNPADVGLGQFEDGRGNYADKKIYLQVPYDRKNAAQELGARWDKIENLWYVPPHKNLEPFIQWLNPVDINKDHQKSLKTFIENHDNIADISSDISEQKIYKEWAKGSKLEGKIAGFKKLNTDLTVLLVETDNAVVVKSVSKGELADFEKIDAVGQSVKITGNGTLSVSVARKGKRQR